MIQASAPSLSSGPTLASGTLASGTLASSGGDTASTADFAALLGSTLTGQADDTPSDAQAAPNPEPTPDLAARLQARQTPGKASGKRMPDTLPDLANTLTRAWVRAERIADPARDGITADGEQKKPPAKEEAVPAAAPAPIAPTEILLPSLAVPAATPPPPALQSAPAPSSSVLAQTAALPASPSAPRAVRFAAASGQPLAVAPERAGAPGVPLAAPPGGSPAIVPRGLAMASATGDPIPARANAKLPISTPAPPSSPVQAAAAPAPVAAASSLAPALQPAAGFGVVTPRLTAAAAGLRVALPTASQTPQPAVVRASAEPAPVIAPAAGGPDTDLTAPAALPVMTQEIARLPVENVPAGPSPAQAATPSAGASATVDAKAPLAQALVPPAVPTSAAAPPPADAAATTQLAALAPVAVDARVSEPTPDLPSTLPPSQFGPGSEPLQPRQTGSEADPRPARAKADDTLPLAAAPALAAADLRPELAMREAQSLAQAALPVVAAPATATATSAAIGQPTPQDYAMLVDRLVEARDAAAPQSVQASIAHSDFGQVSLRFEQDGEGLAVAMTSADPDFARAVQAGAPAGMAQTAGEEPRQDAPRQDSARQDGSRPDMARQDAPGQQAASSASGQSQAFARDRGQSRPQTDTPARRAAGQPRDDDAATGGRSGIYA